MSPLHAPGSIVRARGRDWVVQQGSPDVQPPVYELLPLGGQDAERTLLHADLEPLESATFDLPDPAQRGDHIACRMMRDAARLVTRNAAGPYRSFGRLGFDPRPYQLVPLMLAMQLDPVRMLLADDVGIGKTIEALMIARELLDRGEITGFSVLCPPHLANQWAKELKNRFHIEATLVLAGTTLGLERTLQSVDETIFTKYPITIVSLDYVKQPRRRNEFVQSCPQLVIVDEAHSCAPAGGRGATVRQQRHEVLKALAAKPDQHVILVTATPHSGNDHSYASLLGLLDPRFGPEGELAPDCADQDARIKALSRHFVQRRRKDILQFLGDTKFPERQAKDLAYALSVPMKALVGQVAGFAEEYMAQDAGGVRAPRARGWALLSLLQAIASSPAAAAATLAQRAGGAAADREAAASDVIGALQSELQAELLDELEDDAAGGEVSLSVASIEAELSTLEQDREAARKSRRFFEELRGRAAAILPKDDAKLAKLLTSLKEPISEKRGVVVFCRFVATAEYLRREIEAKYSKKAAVECVVGTLPDEERTKRIDAMVEQAEGEDLARILVCTDCLSEGINLQESFDTVVHYDLSWNPNRHVQREGRVDRFGQPRDTIHVLQLWSDDTLFDAVVLDNNRKKRERIANELGYHIPIPITRDVLLNEILALARKLVPTVRTGYLFDELEQADAQAAAEAFDRETERMLKNERTFRSRFSQHRVDPASVEAELAKVRAAIGHDTVAPFLRDGLRGNGVAIDQQPGFDRVELQSDTPAAVQEIVERTLPKRRGERRIAYAGDPGLRRTLVVRTHPLVEQLAAHILECALDPHSAGAHNRRVASRCGAMRVGGIGSRTLVVLLRHRFQIRSQRGATDQIHETLAEEVHPVAWAWSGTALARCEDKVAADLVLARPAGANIQPAQVQRLLGDAIDLLRSRPAEVAAIATERAEVLRQAHESARHRRARTRPATVVPVGTADILGVYVYLSAEGDPA
jgi:superfamily II DNA or RNA helicase